MNTNQSRIAETHQGSNGKWHAQEKGPEAIDLRGRGFASPSEAAANLCLQYDFEHITHYEDRAGRVRKIADSTIKKMLGAEG